MPTPHDSRGALLAQDPDEPFDLYDPSGAPLGLTKARALVHRDGDWHASVHLWLALRGPDGAWTVVLQERGAHKDTWPGRLDASATGHLAVGERRDDALREAHEELGLTLSPDEVCWLGVRRSEHRAEGVLDREHQHVGLALQRGALEALTPREVELEALWAVPLEELEALFRRRPARAHRLAAARGARARPAVVSPDALIPGRERYHAAVLRALGQLTRGEPLEPLEPRALE